MLTVKKLRPAAGPIDTAFGLLIHVHDYAPFHFMVSISENLF